MKAIVKQRHGDGYVSLIDVSEPQATNGTVLVKVGFAGICGSDLMILHDRFPSYTTPVIMGHEFAGTIEDVGLGVDDLAIGDRVACETHAYVCGGCAYCRSGLYNLCPNRRGFGYDVDGAFARVVVVRNGIIHHLPDGMELKDAAVLEPLSVAVNALMRNAYVRPGESVLIIGPGPIGLLCLQVAKLSGANVTIVGTNRNRFRLSVASKLGADSIMMDSEFVDGIEKGALHDSYDIVVIATGQPASFETALRAARKNGRVVQVGESTERATFQFSLIERKNLTVKGSFSHNWPIWEAAISLAKNNKIDLRSIISHDVSLSDWKNAFDLTESRAGVKVLMHP